MEIEKIYGDLPVLETERLILRKVTTEDMEDMHLYGSDEEIVSCCKVSNYYRCSDTKAFIDFVLNKYENKQVSPWGIEYKENGKFIGTIDFVWWQPNHKIAEIGYVISKEYWGKGLTTEVAKEIIKFGFEEMDLVRIQARCDIENIGSARVMEKAGMSFEGIIRKGICVKGKHPDLKMYSILKEEF